MREAGGEAGQRKGLVQINAKKFEGCGIAPLDAFRERLQRGVEAGCGLLQLPCAVMVPVEAPTETLAFSEMDRHAAAMLVGFCNRNEVSYRDAVFLAEIIHDRLRIFFSARDEVEQIVALFAKFGRRKETEFIGILREADLQFAGAELDEEFAIVGGKFGSELGFSVIQVGLCRRLPGAPAPAFAGFRLALCAAPDTPHRRAAR